MKISKRKTEKKNAFDHADNFRRALVKALNPVLMRKLTEKKLLLEHQIKLGNGLLKTPEQERIWQEKFYRKLRERYDDLHSTGYYHENIEAALTASVHNAYSDDSYVTKKLERGEDVENFKVLDHWSVLPLPKTVGSYIPSIRFKSGVENIVNIAFDRLIESIAIREFLNEKSSLDWAEYNFQISRSFNDSDNTLKGRSSEKAGIVTEQMDKIPVFPVPGEILIEHLLQQVKTLKLIADKEDIHKLILRSFRFNGAPIDPSVENIGKKLIWRDSQVHLVAAFTQYYTSCPPVILREYLTKFLFKNFIIATKEGTRDVNEDSVRKAMRDYPYKLYGGKTF